MITEGQRRGVDGVYVNAENRERKLKGKTAVVIGNSWDVNGVNAEIAIALAREGVQIKGIVGNSRKEHEEARKLSMYIEDKGGDIDIIRADIKSPEDRERLQKEVREKIDILILSPLGTEEINAWVDMLPKVAEGGTVFLIAEDNERGQLLRSATPEFQAEGVSFTILCPPEVEDCSNGVVGEKVVGLLKQSI